MTAKSENSDNSAGRRQGDCSIFWHITAKCNHHCPHCLRRPESQLDRELTTGECHQVLDSFMDFAATHHLRAGITFSGGNPLLRADLPELLLRIKEYKAAGRFGRLGFLANPETLDADTVALLKDCGTDHFFISLDGLEETTDRMRGAGSFQAGVRGIKNLSAAGITVDVKFTLVRENARELLPVVQTALDAGARTVAVGHLITEGGGYGERARRMTPGEYREFLLDILTETEKLPSKYQSFRQDFIKGNRALYALLFWELGRFDEFKAILAAPGGFGPFAEPRDGKNPGAVHAGFWLWHNGQVAQGREGAYLGVVPRDSFELIYQNNPGMRHDPARREKIKALSDAFQNEQVTCRECPVREYCPPVMRGFIDHRPVFAVHCDCWRLPVNWNACV